MFVDTLNTAITVLITRAAPDFQTQELHEVSVPKKIVEQILIYTLVPICWITVALRLWVRMHMTNSAGLDDVVMIITLILFTLYCVFIMLLINNGGLSAGSTLHKTLPNTIKYVQTSEVLYIAATTALRVSLGLFFVRILVRPWQKWVIYVNLTVSTVAGFFYMLLAIFQCGIPTNMAEKVISNKGCIPHDLNLASGYVYSSISIIADWSFVIVPIFMLRGSTLNKRSKLSVSVIIFLGSVGSIAAAVRMKYLHGILFTPDFFYQAADVAIWSTIEPGTGIIAGCLAGLRPLFKHALRGIRNRAGSYSTSKRGTTMSYMDRAGFQTIDEEAGRLAGKNTDSKSNPRTSVRWVDASSTYSTEPIALTKPAEIVQVKAAKPGGNIRKDQIRKVVEVDVTRT